MLGAMLGAENGTVEFLGWDFLLVFNSNCRPPTHHLATVHECEQLPMTNCQPMNNMQYSNMCLSLE